MGARDDILGRVREALAHRQRTDAPEYPDDVAVARGGAGDRVALFSERLVEAGGRVFQDVAALAAWLRAQGATRGYADPALRFDLGADLSIEGVFSRERVDEYQFGITRARGGIAETGSIILDDRGTSSRLGSLAPWIHVAVVAPERIYPRLADAIASLGDDPYVIFCTGPSKTADVEGILIEGVHGPGHQIALLLPG